MVKVLTALIIGVRPIVMIWMTFAVRKYSDREIGFGDK